MPGKRFINIIFPTNSFRRKALKKLLVSLRLRNPIPLTYYNTWMHQQDEHPSLHKQITGVEEGPLVSIVIPAFNTPERYVNELLYSIISQAYQNWELILVNASTEEEARSRIEECAQHDRRIKVVSVPNNGIAANTNAGIAVASGTYIAFCDHDDVLDPYALHEVVAEIIQTKADIVYTDEDKISDNGEVYFDPHFKPDYSPDLLTHVNYINHLTVVRKALIDKVGGLNPERDGAQDYDLLLRLIAESPKISHVPLVLYHWRAAQNSTATDFSSKKRVTDAGRQSLEEHFVRQGVKTSVIPKIHQPGFYELRFPPEKSISIILLPFAESALLRLYVELLIKYTATEALSLEVIIPDTINPCLTNDEIKVITIPITQDYLVKAAQKATHENLVVFGQIALPTNSNWLGELCAPLRLKHIFAISPLIGDGQGLLQDCGLVQNTAGDMISLFKDLSYNPTQTFFGNTNWVRNVDALTGGVTAIKKKVLAQALATMPLHEPPHRIIRKLTLNRPNGTYNIIFSEVLLSAESISLKPSASSKQSMFNPNLMPVGKDYVPYTPEAAAISILMRYDDFRENPV